MASQLTIGQLAKSAGVHVQTVRYDERLRLLRPTARAASGYRLYGVEEERRLRCIKNAQVLGFTLKEIGELLNLRGASTARCGDVQRKAQAKLAHVKAKVRDLQTLARALQQVIHTCRAGLPINQCQIVSHLETQQGPTAQAKKRQ